MQALDQHADPIRLLSPWAGVGEDVKGRQDPGDLVLGTAAPGLGQDDDRDERPDARTGQFVVQGEEVRVAPFDCVLPQAEYLLQLDPASTQHLSQGRARRELLGLLVHALPVGRIGGRPGGDAPPAGEELIQRRQVDDGRMGDCFELGIERGDVGGGQGRAYGGEGPLDVRMGPVVSLDGHDEA